MALGEHDQSTESVDVSDALGANIRVDSRGTEAPPLGDPALAPGFSSFGRP